MNKKFIYIILFSVIFSSQSKVGTTAAQFLGIGVGSKAMSMGGAFTSIGAGVLGVPYNPASIAFVKNQEGFLSKTNYVADISYQVLGYGRNLSGIDFVGLHAFF